MSNVIELASRRPPPNAAPCTYRKGSPDALVRTLLLNFLRLAHDCADGRPDVQAAARRWLSEAEWLTQR